MCRGKGPSRWLLQVDGRLKTAESGVRRAHLDRYVLLFELDKEDVAREPCQEFRIGSVEAEK